MRNLVVGALGDAATAAEVTRIEFGRHGSKFAEMKGPEATRAVMRVMSLWGDHVTHFAMSYRKRLGPLSDLVGTLMPQLEVLDMSGCGHFSDRIASQLPLGVGTRMEKLDLSFTGCRAPTALISAVGPRLKHLNLDGIKQPHGRRLLCSIASACPFLEWFSITAHSCSPEEASALASLANLKVLRLQVCRVPVLGEVAEVTQTCTKLERLALAATNCSVVGSSGEWRDLAAPQ